MPKDDNEDLDYLDGEDYDIDYLIDEEVDEEVEKQDTEEEDYFLPELNIVEIIEEDEID